MRNVPSVGLPSGPACSLAQRDQSRLRQVRHADVSIVGAIALLKVLAVDQNWPENTGWPFIQDQDDVDSTARATNPEKGAKGLSATLDAEALAYIGRWPGRTVMAKCELGRRTE